jgi:hypothetical protein
MTLAETIARIPAAWPSGAQDFRTAAALVAEVGFGRRAVEQATALVNCGALALAMGSRPLVHSLRDDALTLIEATDLRSAPASAPELFRHAVIIEASGLALFGETTDLGIYQVPDGRYGLLGYTGRDPDGGAMFSLWRPHWAEEDLNDPEIVPAMDEETEGVAAWTRDAVRFVLIYGLLLEAERTPLAIDERAMKQKRSVEARNRAQGRSGWVTRYISLATRDVVLPHDTGTEQTTGDRIAELRRVSGHLKRQVYGPDRAGRRWIYISAYEARRWLTPGPRRLIVGRGPASKRT